MTSRSRAVPVSLFFTRPILPISMPKSFSITSEFDPRDVMSDLGLCFADRPLHRLAFDVTQAGIQTLSEAFAGCIFRARRRATPDGMHWHTLLLRFAQDRFVVAFGEGRDWGEVYAPSAPAAEALFAEITSALEQDDSTAASCFYMLRFDCGEFFAERIENVPDDPGDDFLRLCYGEDILSWMGQFNERTSARAGGLTILEGAPGTGKTSLLSVMMRRLARSHVFYVLPVAQDDALSSPEMVPFWQAQNKRHRDRVKVIVIEDAESLLWPRAGDGDQAVSAVLNIADGFLGRMLRLHLACSVNAPMSQLDPAVTRPGRLINHRVFRRLPRCDAIRLAEFKSLAFEPPPGIEDFALAEVLNPGSSIRRSAGRVVGFQPSPRRT
jgi:hypothetical protein